MTLKNEISLFEVVIHKKYKDFLLINLAKMKDVHIKVKGRLIKRQKEEEKRINKKIEDLRISLKDLLKKLEIHELDLQEINVNEEDRISFAIKDVNDLATQLSEEIKYYANRFDELEKYISMTKIELEKVEIIKETYIFLEKINLSQASLLNLNHFNFEVYSTFSKNLKILIEISESSEIPNVIQTYPISNERVAFFIIYPKDKEKDLIERISLVYPEKVPLLKKYLSIEGINFERINKEIDLIKTTLSKYEKELKRIRDNNLLKFAAINEAVYNIEEFNWVENQFEEVSINYLDLKFFAPRDKKEEIKQKLIKIFRKKIKINIIDIERTGKPKKVREDLRDETPTLMRHNRIIRPFETLTKMYGVPSYSEIDPTPFLFISFPLLFGIMFGDIGHGLVLVISGIIGSIVFKKRGGDIYNFSWIIFWCGLWTIIGGFFYGEFFGTDEILGYRLEPIPIPIPFIGPIILHDPLNNVMTIFILTIFIGVFHINFGWMIQFVNFWRNSKKYKAFTETLMKILFLDGGILLIFVWRFDLNSWFAPPFPPILFPLIPGLLLILFKPLGKIFGISYMKKESFSSLLGEGSMDTFETVLSVPSNVLSYVRLLALLLAHISLMVAIRAMIEIIPRQDLWYVQLIIIIGLIFGNLVVILLEGVIVFLNAIRLHFYEFFFKFYEGRGKEFIPFILKEDFSSFSFKIEAEKDIISKEIEKEIEPKEIKEDITKARDYITKKFF